MKIDGENINLTQENDKLVAIVTEMKVKGEDDQKAPIVEDMSGYRLHILEL